jgi:regulator of protease activity HflC (stomatin/prohibitin superfamily)
VSHLRRLGAVVRAAAAAFLVVCVEFFSVPWRRVAIGGALLLLALFLNPPVRGVLPGELGVRVNRVTGAMALMPEGPVLVAPFVHALRIYSLRDQVYRPERNLKSAGEAPFQSIEGLSIGMEVTVRYALDPDRLAAIARRLPQDVGKDLVEPVVDGVLYRTLARYTVKEIFSDKRAELQQKVEDELRRALEPDGVRVRAAFLGNVDLPAQYRQGMEGMIAQELETQKMRFTLELKEKQIKQVELDGEAKKAERAKQAEAAALEEVIAAKGKADAMRHVLPFKKKEIEQSRLEAEARKMGRLKDAEAAAEQRRIESQAEADARRKLADADAYRLDVTGKAQSEQMAREADIIGKNPILVQKAFAEKMSEHLQVVVAPAEAAAAFFQAGGIKVAPAQAPARAAAAQLSAGELKASIKQAMREAREEEGR